MSKHPELRMIPLDDTFNIPILEIKVSDTCIMYMNLQTFEFTNIKLNDMNKLQITPPDGQEIDIENSDLAKGIIALKESKKVLTYKDVIDSIINKCYYSIDIEGGIEDFDTLPDHNGNEAPSSEQLEALLALNKLKNVANYLNGDWKPDWDSEYAKYCIYLNSKSNLIIDNWCRRNYGVVVFKSYNLAEQAIEILGKDTVKLALSFSSL
jgi:hypothetical protein